MPKEILRCRIEAVFLSCISDPHPQITASLARWVVCHVLYHQLFFHFAHLTATGNLSDAMYSDASGCMWKGLKPIKKLSFLDNYIMSLLALAYFTFPWFFFMRLAHNVLNCLSSCIHFLDGSLKNSIRWWVRMLWFFRNK